ncbi:sensor histidine kinase [Paenibacillus nasutitermitis]|uniref:histidine kinase n=1 Tax=Paenibacillus nasutitermitis TaxID=1652958 RepID=A0A916ZDF2_9BACL|nr:histidine kinase [Paenibacillus nasutitermitis]GGD90459.1 sensor histidine kinase YesM [Paenibacillus nasutitermitis]
MIKWTRYFLDQLRFRQKLVLSYLIISIIPILILGTYSYYQSKTFLKEQALKSFQRNVDVISESIQSNMDHYVTMSSLILYNNVIQRILSNQYLDLYNLYLDFNQFLNPYMNMLLNLNKDTKQLTIYTKSQLPEYGEYINKMERITDEAWYTDVKQVKGIKWYHENNQLFIAGQFPKLFSSNSSSLTVSDENILYIRVNNRSLFADLPDSLREHWVFLVDRLGNSIYSNQIMDTETVEMLGEIRSGQEGEMNIKGMEMLMIQQKIPNTDWTLYCLVPYREIVENSGSIVKATLIIAGICILILIVIISVFAKSMIRRIYKLNNWMKRAESGELELRVQSTSKDEIGELTIRFGHMMHRINELVNEGYKNKIIQKEAELKALKSQITPHFLYNTLSFINWKALKSEDHELSHMVTSLSKFYRTALNRGDNIISVKDEVVNVQSYLDIILTMSEPKFDVVYNIDDEVYAYGMINLILQPLVENAIKHGIKRKTEGKGLLEISARLHADNIELRIRDNGPGIQPQLLEHLLSTPTAGYGLKHVDERIKLIFGADFGLSIEKNLLLGACMCVTIPKQMLHV